MDFGITTSVYRKIWLADFFHSFPHLDLSFSEVNSTFNPESNSYREALGFWAGLPLVCCALLWVGFLVFFCARSCHKPDKEPRKTPPPNKKCCRVSIWVFLLLGWAAIAVMFYGNAEIHQGIDNTVHAIKTTNKTIKSSLQTMNAVDRLADNMKNKQMPALTKAMAGITNSTVYNLIIAQIKLIGSSMDSIKDGITTVRNGTSQVFSQTLADHLDSWEHIRWVITIVVCCIHIFAFLILFAGIVKKARRKLTFGACLCVVFIFAMCAETSFHLALAVGSADLCVDPNSYVLSQQNQTVKDAMSVYIECKDKSQPYGEQVLSAQTAVTEALTALNTTLAMSAPFNISKQLAGPVGLLQGNLHAAFGNLSSLYVQAGSCQTLHNTYILAVRGVCHSAFYGVGYVAMCSALVTVCSVCLIICSACTWPTISKRVRYRGYEPADVTDPFVPCLHPYQHDYGSFRGSPLMAESLRQSGAVSINDESDHATNPLLSVSPLPTHHPRHLQEYSNLAPTPSSIVQSS